MSRGLDARRRDALSSVTPVPMGPDHERIVKTAIADMTRYVREVVEERRRAPGEDMVSVLVKAEVDGRKLSDEDLVAFLYLLIVAGLETTVNLISKGFVLLTERKDVASALRQSPDRTPRFVEEMLRYDPPTHSLFRFTTRDVPIGDATIPGGAVVMLMLASANRDPEKFTSPHTFELERDTQGALAFGYGAHSCIGAALARMESRALFDATLKAFSDLERVEPRVDYRHTLTVRGPAKFAMRGVRAKHG